MLLQIEQVPTAFNFKSNKVNFSIFAEKFIEYMEDLTDREAVKDEMRKWNQNFTSLDDIRKEFNV